MENPLKIKSISVTSYKILPEQQGGYVKFYVLVEGRTRFMHPLCISSSQSPCFKFSTRYSELLCLHLELKELLPTLELPAFPKKKWIGSRSNSFISKRILQINNYFTEILSNPEINPSEPLMRLVSPHRPLNLLVIGGPKVGKQMVVEMFIKNEIRDFSQITESKNSMCTQDIVKGTPIDILFDDKLYRIANIDIKTYNLGEGQERLFLNEVLADKHGIIFLYRERGNAGHAIANKLFDLIKDKVPCVLANCDSVNYLNEYSIRNNLDAFHAFQALIKIFKAG